MIELTSNKVIYSRLPCYDYNETSKISGNDGLPAWNMEKGTPTS